MILSRTEETEEQAFEECSRTLQSKKQIDKVVLGYGAGAAVAGRSVPLGCFQVTDARASGPTDQCRGTPESKFHFIPGLTVGLSLCATGALGSSLPRRKFN